MAVHRRSATRSDRGGAGSQAAGVGLITRTKPGDLSITALYTSQVWAWAGLSHANLFATPDAKRVFDATNGALALASLFKRSVSSLPHALLHRHTMIDHLLRESEYERVLELAAGLSRRGAAFSEVHDYTELDLPPVIERKRRLLERTDEGKAVLARPSLHLVGVDVETAELAAYVQPGPLFVIAEGLMMYLPAPARQRLFARIRALAAVTGELRFVFDLVPNSEEPEPGTVGRALEAAMKRFTGGRSFERDVRTRDDMLAELQAAGFVDTRAIAASEVAEAWKLPYPEQRTTMVLFTACSPATAS